MNSEAILQKLIESGYINEIYKELGLFLFFDELGDEIMFVEDFYSHINKNSYEGNEIVLVIQRALFEECAKRDIRVEIVKNKLDLRQGYALIFRADTSRESFALAYQKVVGIE